MKSLAVIGNIEVEKANGLLALIRYEFKMNGNTPLLQLLMVRINTMPCFTGEFYFDKELNDFCYSI